MKCPLIILQKAEFKEVTCLIHADCIKEECAWWDEAESQCALLSLATWQPHLVSLLRAIKEKMSHEEQFRK